MENQLRSFVVTVRLRKPYEEIQHLGPAEGQRVRELTAAGLITRLLLRADATGAWLFMQAYDEKTIADAVASLPMYPHMNVEITEAMDPPGGH